MWIDTHCHLDAIEFTPDRNDVITRAQTTNVQCIIIPSVERINFATVRELAHSQPYYAYALGIHPLYVDNAQEHDLRYLHNEVAQAIKDPRFVAIGEIGLDFFVPGLNREKQEQFYIEQLKIAAKFNLPVLLHGRRAQDALLKNLRRIPVSSGLAHAFNGSEQQAHMFIELGFKLGFGGAMTYDRALQIRRLACQLPLASLVLETDAPDIPPAWRPKQRNEPAELPAIAQVLADLRNCSVQEIEQVTWHNTVQGLPRLNTFLKEVIPV